MQHIKVEDSPAPFEFFKHQGWYTVGDRVFQNKHSAILFASSINADVYWHLSPDEFGSIDWRQRLGVDIRSLYKLRAQQLREKYDYIVLSWSGGADSTVALHAFLDNGIPLDEVMIYWPYELSRGRYEVSWSNDPRNMLSEWDLSIKPQMDRIKKLYPQTKFTILDESATWLEGNECDDDTFRIMDHMPSYVVIKRLRAINRHYRTLKKKHQNLCIVSGIGPIDLGIFNDWLCVVFKDAGTVHRSDYIWPGIEKKTEWFYTTPDLPELAREQAHMMLYHFKNRPIDLKLLPRFEMDQDRRFVPISSGDFIDNLRSLYKSIVYPDYPKDILQVDKPRHFVYNLENADWFMTHPESKSLIKPWLYHLKSQEEVIDPRFCNYQNGIWTSYKSITSSYHPIANLSREIQSYDKLFGPMAQIN